MKNTFSADCKEENQKWRGGARKPHKKKAKAGGKREVERGRKGRNQKNVCESAVKRFLRRFQSAEWESGGDFLGVSECASAVSSSVTVVKKR